MASYADTLARLGVRIPDLLVPRRGVDLSRWAVVACDQFTSQREYWQRAAQIVGDAPSTLHLIFPEVYLDDPHPEDRIASINGTMARYLDDDLFETHPETMFLVRRETANGSVRWGVMVALDLEQYSWAGDARSLIRATEGTILSRIPPRVQVRRNAPLELPHIMVLISDERRTVIEPLAAKRRSLTPVYDTPLMLGGGRVSAWSVSDPHDLDAFAAALGDLHAALDQTNPLLFAMGDGNHSFATAKSIWETTKASLPPQTWVGHPTRYCLVELENIFDDGLDFEPIHRVLFGTSRDDFESELARHCHGFERTDVATLDELLDEIEDQNPQRFGYRDADGFAEYTLRRPHATIAAGTLQRVIDALLADELGEVDYIHGADVTEQLGRLTSNIGLFLPSVSKETFFASIVADGALPRKTFSMGEAEDKRYYVEARRIA